LIGRLVAAAMGGGSIAAATSRPININMNGRKVAQILTPAVSTNQARSVRRG